MPTVGCALLACRWRCSFCSLDVLGVDDQAHHLVEVCIACETSFAGALLETPLLISCLRSSARGAQVVAHDVRFRDRERWCAWRTSVSSSCSASAEVSRCNSGHSFLAWCLLGSRYPRNVALVLNELVSETCPRFGICLRAWGCRARQAHPPRFPRAPLATLRSMRPGARA